MLIASSNFLVPNATFIVELAIFLLVLWILARYVLPPLNRVMGARQQAIERAIEEADDAKKRALEVEEQQRKALEEARQEARAMRDEAAKLGDQLRQELQKRGEDEYQRLVTLASADIEASARKAAEQLRTEVAELVMTVVERVLGAGLTLADQQRLIDQAIAEVESQAASGSVGALGALSGPATGGTPVGS
ncbi:MAG TPA: F0F1 ATP synthase subunit B [Acidimicrobiales bacterium]|nr:F0F1 ATP synthase subunit B [Acidimicrobiales bacterium]